MFVGSTRNACFVAPSFFFKPDIPKKLSPIALRTFVSSVGVNHSSFGRIQGRIKREPIVHPHIFQLSSSFLRRFTNAAKSDSAQLKSPTFTFEFKRSTARLSDIGGYEHVKNEMQDLIKELKNPGSDEDEFESVLFYGPPGTGKTRFVEAIAGEAKAHLLIISSTELLQRYVGEGEAKIKALFDQAAQKTPCVICIDEIDAIGLDRESDDSKLYVNTLVSALLTRLTQMPPDVYFMATTNHLNKLDAALTRSGRLGKQIHIPRPNLEDRKAILEVHLKGRGFSSRLCLDTLSKLSAGFSGATIAKWVQEAARRARREQAAWIVEEDFDATRRIMLAGIPRKISDLQYKRCIAIHELGHAIVGHHLKHHLHAITVYNYDACNGLTEWIPPETRSLKKQEILNEVCCYLAGRANELLMIGTPMQGSFLDIALARKHVREMLEREAMGTTLSGVNPNEIEVILQQELARAINILEKYQYCVESMIQTLVQHSELNRESFLQLLEGKPSTSPQLNYLE